MLHEHNFYASLTPVLTDLQRSVGPGVVDAAFVSTLKQAWTCSTRDITETPLPLLPCLASFPSHDFISRGDPGSGPFLISLIASLTTWHPHL